MTPSISVVYGRPDWKTIRCGSILVESSTEGECVLPVRLSQSLFYGMAQTNKFGNDCRGPTQHGEEKWVVIAFFSNIKNGSG